MPRPRVRALLTILCAAAIVAPSASAAPRLDGVVHERFEPGEAIVRFEPGTRRAERAEARDRAAVDLERSLPVARAQLVTFDGPVANAVRRLERQPGVLYAQPNYRYRAAAPDTHLAELWGLGPTPGVNAAAGWALTRGAGQVIAVVDTGVDLTHPDLAPNLWSNPGEVPGNGVDDDLNGRVDDVRGFDFISNDGDPDDFQYHGTHVAGTAAAAADNSLGIAGVAPAARIMAVRVLDANGGGSSAEVAAGIEYAATEGADVINLSLSGPSDAGDQLLADAVAVARAANAVVVAAAGNDGDNNDVAPVTPCALPADNLICVAAVRQDARLAGFSNTGAASVDVGAPGVGIVSAKTDYVRRFEHGFPGPTLAGWQQAGNGVPWGIEDGEASDSPGGDYANAAYSEIFRASDVNLVGNRGCRIHFEAAYSLGPPDNHPDLLLAGAFDASTPAQDDGLAFEGSNEDIVEVGINAMDGHPDVRPFFGLLSNDDGLVDDGARVDDVRVLCRDSTYVDAIASASAYDEDDAGNYISFNGTSMAAPHVAGIAALVRAAAPGVPAPNVVAAIRTGAKPLPDLAGVTVSGGTADAGGALAALGLLNTGGGGVSNPPPPPPPPPEQVERVLDLRGAPTRLRVSRRRSFTYRFRAASGVRGRAVVRTRVKARVRTGKRRPRFRRTHLVLARKSFRSPASGVVRVRVVLSRREMAVLRLNRRLRLRIRIEATDAQGRVTRARRNLLLLARR